MILELDKINKSFKIDKHTNFDALKDVSLGFNKGEFVAILGPSGCGKSTLLNVIAGLDLPSSGELKIAGKSTKKYKAKNWDSYRKNNIGFVFQQFNLIEHLTALENVELVMSLTGIKKVQRRTRALDLLLEVGISNEHANHLPSQLSGGQKQRVAIARALANDPDIILADEPTGALDTKTGIQVMDLLKEIAKDKLIIMVTHNQKLAYEYSSRVIRILDGAIQSDEQVLEVETNNLEGTLSKKNKAMPFREALRLSFRNMKKKIGRVTITAFAGSIGIAGIALVMGLSNGANIFIGEQLVKFGDSNVVAVDKSEKNKDGELVKVTDKKEFDYLKKNDQVTTLRPKLVQSGTLFYNKKTLDAESGALADTKNQGFIKDFLIGNLPQENKYEILINKATARNIIDLENKDTDKTDVKTVLNKKVTLDLSSSGIPSKKEFKIVGIVDEIDVNQGFWYYNYNDMVKYYKDIDLFTTNYYEQTMKKPEAYEVVIKDPNKLRQVKTWITENSKDESVGNIQVGFAAAMGGQAGTNVSSFALVFQEALSTIINIVQVVMIAFLIVALIVSSILIAIVLFSSILERKTEIGILKAVGARNKDIMRVFQSEAFLLGLFSGIIGITLSFVLVPVAESLVNSFTSYNVTGIIKIPLSGKLYGVTIPFLQILGLIFISTLVAYIAGYLPSRRATKMQVIDALRDE